MVDFSRDMIQQTNAFIGEQQFLFNRDYDQSYTQSKTYIKLTDYKMRDEIEKNTNEFMSRNFPGAVVSISPQQNIFERIFSASEVPLVVELSLMKENKVPPVDKVMTITNKLRDKWPDSGISPPPVEDKITLQLNPDRLLLYDVDPMNVYNTLKTSLSQNNIGELRASYELLPIVLSDKQKQISDIIYNSFVDNRKKTAIPVSEIVQVKRVYDYKTIKGGLHGEYVPLSMNVVTNRPALLTDEIRNMLSEDHRINVSFSGALITGQRLFRELAVILVIALLLLYFILAAQFESLTQPLIVLLEIPIDIAGALLLVLLWGGTINVMTMIGLIVMSGGIINDSILKVDTINNLRDEGMGLVEASYTGGSRRLKPIIMVAMASLISTAPILFSSGLGSELQRPMALALVGGMSLGTVVSLFFIPLAYWYIYRSRGTGQGAGRVASR